MEIELSKVLDYSKDCLQSRAQMRAIMMDLYPGKNRDMNTLLAVYETGIPKMIKNAGMINDEQYSLYINKIIDDYGMTETCAIEALNSWIDICIEPGFSKHLNKNVVDSFEKEKTSKKKQTINHKSFKQQIIKDIPGNVSDYELEAISSDKVQIKRFKGFDERLLTVPNVIDGKKVVGIGLGAFKGCKSVSRIIVSEGIQYIEDGAFSECSTLTEVILPDTLERLGSNKRISKYGDIMPITSTFWDSKDGVFFKTSIKSIILPKGLKFLGNNVFMNCLNLETIDLPNGIKRIGRNVFLNCSALKTVILPDELEEIGVNAFSNSGIIEIHFPDNVEKVEESAFQRCSNLTNVLLNEGLKFIGNKAFQNCTSLKKIIIPSTVISMGTEIFDITGWYQPIDRRRNGWQTKEKNKNLTIYCYAGTVGLEYARNEGYAIANAANVNI